MKIASHRGAAGLALENSLQAIQAAKRVGCDAIELDIRQTANGDFVLSHDPSLTRVADAEFTISDETTATITGTKLKNGEPVPRLEDALNAAGHTPVLLDVKGSGWATDLERALAPFKNARVSVISFNHDELSRFHGLRPDLPVYSIERTRPLDVIQEAKKRGFTGVDFNFWILNPLTYWLARRSGLDIIVYTVNFPWMARYLKTLFPHITITTDVPDKMQVVRD